MALSGSFKTSGYDSRKLQFSWTATQDVTGNKSTISWTLKAVGTGQYSQYYAGNFKVVIDGSTVYSSSTRINTTDGLVIKTGTKTLTHNADGTRTFTVSAEAGIYTYAVNCTGSKTFTLDTIPRKSSVSVPDGTLGQEQTITVTRQSSSFTHSIKAVCGSSTLYIDADGTASATEVKHSDCSIPWTPPIEWASQAAQSQSASVTFTITTYNGSTSVGTNTDTATYAIPDNVIPILAYSVSDEIGDLEYYGGYVQGKSNLTINITTYGVYGAWIKSYKAEIDGKTYTAGTQDGTSITVPIGAVTNYGDLPVKVTVVDSRDRQTVATSTIPVIRYEKPSIRSLTSFRSDANGNAKASGLYLTVRFSCTLYDLGGKNSSWYRVGYKKPGESYYTEDEVYDYYGQFSVTNGTYTFPADDASYDISFTAGDDFNYTSKSTTGASLTHTVSLLKKNGKIVGAAINKLAELEGVFDFGFAVKFSGGVYNDEGAVVAYGEEGDSIVEFGEKDGWTYRKWNSGVAECRKTVTVSTAISTAWGTMYVGNTKMGRQSYPFVFAAKPMEVASLTSAANAVWLFPESGGNGVNGAYQTAIYNVCRPSSVTAAGTYYITIDVIGKWK